jgi:sugar phosphate permease
MNVTIAQWFVRKRGRAMGIANLGTGVAKFTIPLCAASLFVLVGWRSTWAIFGIIAPLLVVVPALIFMHRKPEDIGLRPDGEPPLQSPDILPAAGQTRSTEQRRSLPAETSWSRSEVIQLPTFWLLVVTFGIASVGIAGLNLHIFSYVTDIGYSPLIAASFMSTIALTQLGSTLVWGILADRFDIRKVSCVQFMIQGVGLVVAISSADILLVYAGFFLYGTGLAGSFVLREVIWANFFGRVSLGTVRGLSLFFSNLFAASGAPFFGFLHDRMGSYNLSFTIFSCALFTSSLLILLAKPPREKGTPSLKGKRSDQAELAKLFVTQTRLVTTHVRLVDSVQPHLIQVPDLGISTLNPFAKLRAGIERGTLNRFATAPAPSFWPIVIHPSSSLRGAPKDDLHKPQASAGPAGRRTSASR